MLTLTPPADSHQSFLHVNADKRPPPSKPDGYAKSSTFVRITPPRTMSTSHRGLPPPAAMTLPDPTRGPLHLSQNVNPIHHGGPSPNWRDSEEASHDRLVARVEEDRRKQEEEKTRQEELRLEQRRIEQDILHQSIHGGVPPHLVPVIFAGMAGGPLAQAGFEMAQNFLAQIQQTMQHQQQQQEAHGTPEHRGDTRLGSSHGPYYASQPGSHQQIGQAQPGQGHGPQGQHAASVYPSPAYHSPKRQSKTLYAAPAQYGNHAYAPRGSNLSALPRLTTNEPSAPAPSNYGQQEPSHGSPSIYFHHWQPPSVPKESSSKDSQKTSPNLPSHVSRQQEHSNSPRKRKATGPHQPAPAPSTASPSFSITSTSSNKSGQRPGEHRSKHRSKGSYDPIRSSRANSTRRESSSREASKVDDEERRSRHATPHRSSQDEAMPDVDRAVKRDEPST